MTQLYGRIIDNQVVALNNQVGYDQTDPSVQDLWTAVPADTVVGSVLDGEDWTHPPAPPAPDIVVDVPTFFMLFTVAEEAAIRASADAGVGALLRRIDHPATKNVNLSLQANKDAIAYLAAKQLIQSARVAEILTGVVH